MFLHRLILLHTAAPLTPEGNFSMQNVASTAAYLRFSECSFVQDSQDWVAPKQPGVSSTKCCAKFFLESSYALLRIILHRYEAGFLSL
jgi:hypothetical protein